jgi:hypothetical protein
MIVISKLVTSHPHGKSFPKPTPNPSLKGGKLLDLGEAVRSLV